MRTRPRLPASLFALPQDQLIELRSIIIAALVDRDLPESDASEILEAVLDQIERQPETYASRLASLDTYGNFFIRLAIQTYLRQLQDERWRRRREQQPQSGPEQ